MPRRKSTKSRADEIIDRLNDIREDTVRLTASFEAHLKQDEAFYTEIRDLAKNQSKIADRLGEYNTQLQIHIAGVNELREQTKIMREEREIIKKEYEARLKTLEEQKIFDKVLNKKIAMWVGIITLLGGLITVGAWAWPILVGLL